MCFLLFVMYGTVPFLLNALDLYEVPYAQLNLLFSIVAALFVYALPSIANKGIFSNQPNTIFLKNRLVATIFLAALILFHLFPWHEDRESLGASLAGLFRAAWLFVMFAATQRSEGYKIKIFILSLLLMFVDESRTYFMVGLLVISSSSIYRKSLLIVGIFMVIILAAIRMSISDNSLNFLTYGIVGESYNAVRSVGQVISVEDQPINFMAHLFHTFFQPIVFPFEFIANRILNFHLAAQSSYLSDIVNIKLDEKLSPMGGWYIVADFVYYGYPGIILLLLYMYANWLFTCRLFNFSNFPFGPFLFFISIKSTPYVYWKMLFYLLIIFYLVEIMNKFTLYTRSKKAF